MHTHNDSRYMRRALDLARNGYLDASPNPMVGAVIVADGRIVGEGFHRRCGGPHAEVNAVNSVADPELLGRASIYVTLEPCAHYGKTPPCAKLLIDKKIPRIVIGCADPFAKVSGRGIDMLRQAGREVVVGVLEQECMELNRRFMRAHSQKRPYILLKWARSADGYIAPLDSEGNPCRRTISNAATAMLSHKLRAEYDAIMVGTQTVIVDNPRLDLRHWPGNVPIPVTIDRRGRIPDTAAMFSNPDSIVFGPDASPKLMAETLYADHGITSLIVEGGARMLRSFIDADLFDEIRIETSTEAFGCGVVAPTPPDHILLAESQTIRGNRLDFYRR